MKYLTGIKPTGEVHFGNYISAIAPIININDTDDLNFFIADYHALTTHPSSKDLNSRSIDLLAAICSFLPNKNNINIYRQSQIPQIFELYYILNCFMAKGYLNRAHAYKTVVEDNLNNGRDEDKNVNMGLFTYPVLMAADILICDPDCIPVGKDQIQHIEIMQEVSRKFNHLYKCNLFNVPEGIYMDDDVLIGTDGRKMSKSYQNVIPLFCTKKKLKKMINSIATNSKNEGEPKYAGESAVTDIYKSFSTQEQYDSLLYDMNRGASWGYVKNMLFNLLTSIVTDEKRETYEQLRNNPDDMLHMISQNEKDIQIQAQNKLNSIREIMGLF